MHKHKHLSRVNIDDQTLQIKIDFGEDEVTNMANSYNVMVVSDIAWDSNLRDLDKDKERGSIVSIQLLYDSSFLLCRVFVLWSLF